MFWLEILSIAGLLIWTGILLAPWRAWSTRERLDAKNESTLSEAELSEISVLIPARNEEEEIGATLQGLKAQHADLPVVVVNDQSTDRTEEVARSQGLRQLQILSGQELESGWSGKLWALEQGRKHITTDYLLLIDADIQLKPGTLSALLEKMKTEELDFVSLMAKLRMKNFWEKLLIPAFIYFFKLLYPFSLGNNPKSSIAVAAGGCILIKRKTLEELGGFGALRDALIDDCTLAKKVKGLGKKTWMGLTHSVSSNRAYTELSEIWNMVARTAFTQLHYSSLLLLGCSFALVSAFWSIPLGLSLGLNSGLIFGASAFAGVFMLATYIPTLFFYRLSPLWALLLPLSGTLYLLMTWTSAIRYWRGKRSQWKGRVYQKEAA